MKSKLLITFQPPADVIERAKRDYDVTVADHTLTTDEMIAACMRDSYDALMIVFAQKFNSSTIARLSPSVKIVATYSVGFEHLDVASGEKRGLVFSNTPDVLTDATADTAFLLMMNVLRRARPNLHIMENGWSERLGLAEGLGLEPKGRTVGIFGMGRIGQAFAHRAKALGMKVVYHNRKRLKPEEENGARYFADLDEMLPHCQVLSLHAPGGSETSTIMNDRTFALLPKDAVFINTARGSLVDEDSLIHALESKHLFGAGLDVFQNEPDFNKQLLKFENVYLFPHIGSATVETRNAMGFRALDNIDAALSGRKVPDELHSSPNRN